MKDVYKTCSIPDNHFGFKEGYSREYVHYVLVNVLMDTEKSGDFLVLAAHDFSRAYNSSVHSHLLYSAQHQGLYHSVVRVFQNLYAKLYNTYSSWLHNKVSRNSSLERNPLGLGNFATTF